MVETIKKSIEQIQELKQYLPEKTQEELDEILAYGEKMKLEGERKKQEFWKNHDRNDFKKLLRYKRENKNRIEGQYKYLDMIEGLERERFIEEYLHDDMLYSGKLDEPIEGELCSYNCWKEGNAVIKVGTNLFFCNNQIGAEGAKEIAEKLELKEWVILNLENNEIGAKGVKEIAEKLELKECVILNLENNKIGAEGAKAIAKNIELKEGVHLYLGGNQIGAEGAKVIAEKMELKEGVYLGLQKNGIGDEGAKAIASMELKDGIKLNLENNKIGAEGAKAIAGMELKEGVNLDLQQNGIGDDGAEAIMKNMKLKEGVSLYLRYNNISDNVKARLEEWEKSYKKRGIKCIVIV